MVTCNRCYLKGVDKMKDEDYRELTVDHAMVEYPKFARLVKKTAAYKHNECDRWQVYLFPSNFIVYFNRDSMMFEKTYGGVGVFSNFVKNIGVDHNKNLYMAFDRKRLEE